MTRRAEDSEILSVVDSTDSIIGEDRRDEIHRLELRHRAIHALVFKPEGAVFLQKRGLHKQENPGMWDSSVAGHVDAGESYDECCVREIKEEVGLVLDHVPPRLFKLDATAVTGMEFAWVYRLETDQVLKLNQQEISGQNSFVRWPDSVHPAEFCRTQLTW